MLARIFSQVVGSLHYRPSARFFQAVTVITVVAGCHHATAQENQGARPGYFTDPQTGIVYRQVSKMIERPIIETKMESKKETVYRPQTVTETKPETQTVYTPVVKYKWEPRLHGRWNPFQTPTVAYHHVPTSHWEARSQVVNKTNTRTQWVAENRTVEVPHQTVRMERQQKVEFEAVGQVAKPAQPAVSGLSNEIAARLRPLDNATQVQPLGATSSSTYAIASRPALGRLQPTPRIAASTIGRMTSDPPRRNPSQGGLRARDLMPVPGGVQSQALPPSTGGVGIAKMPALPFMR